MPYSSHGEEDHKAYGRHINTIKYKLLLLCQRINECNGFFLFDSYIYTHLTALAMGFFSVSE